MLILDLKHVTLSYPYFVVVKMEFCCTAVAGCTLTLDEILGFTGTSKLHYTD